MLCIQNGFNPFFQRISAYNWYSESHICMLMKIFRGDWFGTFNLYEACDNSLQQKSRHRAAKIENHHMQRYHMRMNEVKKKQRSTTSTKNLHKSQPQEWLKEVQEPRKWNKNRNQIDGKNNKRQIKAETCSVKATTTTASIYIKTNASTDRRCVLFFVKLILF